LGSAGTVGGLIPQPQSSTNIRQLIPNIVAVTVTRSLNRLSPRSKDRRETISVRASANRLSPRSQVENFKVLRNIAAARAKREWPFAAIPESNTAITTNLSERLCRVPRVEDIAIVVVANRQAFAAIQGSNTPLITVAAPAPRTRALLARGSCEAIRAVARASAFVVYANTNTQENQRHAQSGRCPTTHCSGLATSVALRAPSSASR
jgi:hypothetical protein